MKLSRTQTVRAIERRKAIERRAAEQEETAQLAAQRREKTRKEREEQPEVYWIKRLAWAIWIFTGVETIKALISIWPG